MFEKNEEFLIKDGNVIVNHIMEFHEENGFYPPNLDSLKLNEPTITLGDFDYRALNDSSFSLSFTLWPYYVFEYCIKEKNGLKASFDLNYKVCELICADFRYVIQLNC